MVNVHVPRSGILTLLSVSVVIQALVNIKNLLELLSEEADVLDQPNATDMPRHPAPTNGVKSRSKTSDVSVEFSHVYFNYSGQPKERGLQDISLVVPAGTTTALVGTTGSGKTTISRLLFRFYDPHQGVVSLNGRDIKQYTQSSVRGMIGVVPQDTVLFNDTILYNIQYGRRDATFEEVKAATAAAQILHFIESLPLKWDTVVGERGLKLSGGEVRYCLLLCGVI